MRKVAVALLCGALYWLGSPASADANKKKKKDDAPAAAKLMSPEEAAVEIKNADPAVAARAAEALGAAKARKSARALDALLDALALGLHPDVAAAALVAVGNHAKPSALDTIEYYAGYRNPKVRAAAITAAGAFSDARSTQLVLAALHDAHASVRSAAAEVVRQRKLGQGIEPLIALLKRGDDAAVLALAATADADLARVIAEQIGSAPDGALARCLGAILMRPDFSSDDARVQVVYALGKIPGNESLEQLTNYVGSVPENPPRQSRKEAETIIEQRLAGGN